MPEKDRASSAALARAGNRKKLWKAVRCVLFLLLLGYLLLHISYVLRQVKWRYNRNTFPGFYGEADDSLDIVTMGSSACYLFFDTPLLYENFGYTSYNLGVPSEPVTAVPYLMEEVEKSQSPELYVVEARKYIKKPGKYFVRTLYLLTDSMNLNLTKWNMIRHSFSSIAKCVQDFLDLWKHHSFWSELTTDKFKYWNNSITLEMKGWRNRTKVKPIEKPDTFGDIPAMPLDEENERELRSLLEECRAKGREVLFVIVPFSYGEAFEAKKKTFCEIVESYGFRCLDLTDGESYGLDYSRDFWDSRHVNYRGAQKVTNMLGEYIEKEYNIQAQHTAEVKADWDRYAARNRENVQAILAGEEASADEAVEEEDFES